MPSRREERRGRRALRGGVADVAFLPERPRRDVRRAVGEALHRAALLVDRDQQRRVATGGGGRLELRDEPRDVCIRADVAAEEDDAADLAGADPCQQRGARRRPGRPVTIVCPTSCASSSGPPPRRGTRRRPPPRARRGPSVTSDCDVDAARDEHPDDVEPVVQDDHVGGQARPEPADLLQPEHPRRDARRSGDRLASGTPSSCRFRTAWIIVSTLPASTPSGPRTVPFRTSTSRLPNEYSPSLAPAPVIESVTSASRPAAARQVT